MRHKPNTSPEEEKTIPAIVSLREAARRLDVNPHFAKGLALGMGIRLQPAGNALVMTEADFHRLERKLGPAKNPRRKRSGTAAPK